MKVLVTGGSGFIGGNLTKRLIQDGHEVTIVSTGAESKIDGVKKVLYMGLTGIDFCFVKGQDIVFHQMGNNDTLCKDRSEMYLANYYGPQKLFVEAALGGCKQFVYASSTAVYGNSPAPYTEDTPADPLNVYAESKLDFDRWAMQFAKDRKLKVSGLRYCNVYGPGEKHKGSRMSMIGQMLRTHWDGELPIQLFENGEQKRDWVYVKDVVEANILASNRTKGDYGEIYNIGSGTARTFNEIAQTIFTVTKRQNAIKYIPNPISNSYQNHTECNIEKAGQQFNYYPAFDLKDGIREYSTFVRFTS